MLVMERAEAVPALTPMPQAPKTENRGEAKELNCDRIALDATDALEAFSVDMESQNSAMTSFLTQAGAAVEQWSQVLSPLEGQTQSLKPGLFAPIREGSKNFSEALSYVYDNNSYLSDRLSTIITRLKACRSESVLSHGKR